MTFLELLRVSQILKCKLFGIVGKDIYISSAPLTALMHHI